jgi:hypothetical protein
MSGRFFGGFEFTDPWKPYNILPMNTAQLNPTTEANMADFRVSLNGFGATEATFYALTDRAQRRIWGAISMNVVKSAAPDFAEQLWAEGFIVE